MLRQWVFLKTFSPESPCPLVLKDHLIGEHVYGYDAKCQSRSGLVDGTKDGLADGVLDGIDDGTDDGCPDGLTLGASPTALQILTGGSSTAVYKQTVREESKQQQVPMILAT